MGKLIDLTDKRFGSWTVLARDGGSYQPLWLCRCECGTERSVSGANLRTGASTNCGCKRVHVVSHGHARRGAKTRTYSAWKAMLSRCGDEARDHRNYADRGIAVCERWRSYENFLADMGECPLGLTLDRADNDKGYQPGNCRWTTRAVQRRNSRRLSKVQCGGTTMILKDAAAAIGITDSAIFNDHRRNGGSLQDAFDRVASRR